MKKQKWCLDFILPIFYYYLRATTAKPVHGINEEYFNFKYRETLRSQGRMHTSFKYDRTGRLTGKQTKRPGAGIILDRSYSYDNLNRLAGKQHNRQRQSDYRYDVTGHYDYHHQIEKLQKRKILIEIDFNANYTTLH